MTNVCKMPTMWTIAPNLIGITANDVDAYFSYNTCVAFNVDGKMYITKMCETKPQANI